MKKLFSNRGFLAVLVLVALVAGVAIGGAFFARTVSDPDDDTASAQSDASSTTTREPNGDGEEGSDAASGESGLSVTPPPGEPADPSELRVVPAASGGEWAYSEPEQSPTPLPPTLPAEVMLSSTQNLAPGDPVHIRVSAKEGSQMFGYEVRLCRKDAPIEGMFDFFPAVAPNCIANPLSPDSDSYVEVRAQSPYQAADGTFRVGLGTDTYTMDDGSTASITCSKSSPCQLVLRVQVPHGFGYYKYDLGFA
jgi:hypothetical protein